METWLCLIDNRLNRVGTGSCLIGYCIAYEGKQCKYNLIFSVYNYLVICTSVCGEIAQLRGVPSLFKGAANAARVSATKHTFERVCVAELIALGMVTTLKIG